ncbi:MAG: carboxypeptidase-like regulatory domain-containing protein [Planctomycetota bacterium]
MPIRSGVSLILHVSCRRFLVEEVNVTAYADSPVNIVLVRAPRISGTVVDPRGEPIEGYRLQALDDAGKAIAYAITDAQGQFDLLRRETKTDGRVVVSEVFTNGHGFLVERPSVAWGTEDVMLRTHSSGQLEIRVKRADDATPVTAFAVCLLHHEHQGPQGWDVRSPVRGTSDDGVIHLRSIPGPVSFVVIPDDPALQPSDINMVQVPGYGAYVAHVNVSPGRVQRIRVFDRQSGLGVADAVVRIIVGVSDPENPPDATLPRVSEVHGLRILAWSRIGALTKAKTGADGTAVVRWVGPATEALLRCEHPQYRAANVRLAPSPEPVAAEIALDRGIRIRGVVKPVDILQFKPVVRAVEEQKGVMRSKWVAVDAHTGAFELDVDSPGAVRLDLAITMSDGVPVLTAQGIANVVVGSEPSPEVIVLDCTAHLPGRVVGRVPLDGNAPAKVRAHRSVNGVGNPGWAAEAVVGEDGTFAIAPMLVGEWLFSAVARNADPFSYRPDFFASCTVQAGMEAQAVATWR